MGVGQFVMRYIGGVEYGNTAMLLWLFPAEFATTLLLVYVTARFFSLETAGLGSAKGIGRWVENTLVIIPVALAALLLALWFRDLSPHSAAKVDKGVLLIGILTLGLVGISEEWMFRGLILRHFAGMKELEAALSKVSKNLMARGLVKHDWSSAGSKAAGILASAVLFSLFHANNAIGGYPLSAVIYQLVGTLALGVFFGALACWLPSIRPLMAWHFLWDYFIILGNYFHMLK